LFDHHPRYAEAWEYDEEDEEELWGHRISMQEVQQVWANDPVWAQNKRHRAGDWLMLGLTNGGRSLSVVVRWNSDRRTVEPITGWDSTDGEKRRYFR